MAGPEHPVFWGYNLGLTTGLIYGQLGEQESSQWRSNILAIPKGWRTITEARIMRLTVIIIVILIIIMIMLIIIICIYIAPLQTSV